MQKKREQIKTHRVTVRLPDDLYDDLKHTQNDLGLTMSDVICASLRDNISSYKVVNLPDNVNVQDVLKNNEDVIEQLNKIRHEIHRIGVNINQVVHDYNLYGEKIKFYQLPNVLTRISTYMKAIDNVTEGVSKEWQSLI